MDAPAGETGHRLIAEVVQTYLLTASGHLGGLAALYSSGEVIFPPAMLVRAVIENCAQAMWVLGDEPTEDSDLRLARAYLQDLLSAEEAKKNAGRLGEKTGAVHQEAAAVYAALKGQILARFPGTTTEEIGKYLLRGQRLLKPKQCVSWMCALLEKGAASNVGDRAALGVYGFLSNMTHPTLYPARQLREWHADEASGHAESYLRLDLDFLERQASAAVMTFYNALSFVTSYNDWERSIFEQLTGRVDEVMPNVFHDES